jgi:carboxylesterase
LKYASDYKRYEGKSKAEIEEEVNALRGKTMPSLAELTMLVDDVKEQLPEIDAPLLVIQSRNDEVIDSGSANVIYENAASERKQIKWYEKSGHVITLGPEKEDLHETVFEFLESLDWNV